VWNLYFTNKDGKLMKLSQFAVVKEGSGPSQLERRDKSTSVKVQSQAVGRPSGTVSQEFEGKLGSIPKPTGVSYVWGGDMENQSEGFGTLGVALMVSIVLVYL